MATPKGYPFLPFDDFVGSFAADRRQDYTTKLASKVQSEEAFEQMRSHLVSHYRNVKCLHSFVDQNDHVFDCIPIEHQPSLKGRKFVIPKPPIHPGRARAIDELKISPQLRPDLKDRFGNLMWCPPGTIPMRRITMQELSRFETLRHYFQKSPVGGRCPRPTVPDVAPNVHRYAHAYQTVNNLGGCSFLNVWDPAVDSQIFSLSQQWYVGGAPLQTAEVGWQVFPQHYNTTKPVLFVYWTADEYVNTGCYNLEAPAFVQTSKNWMLGGALPSQSVSGGEQYGIEISYYLSQGNWWLYIGGTDVSNVVGYYPTTLYNGGQMASYSTEIDFGGEAVDETAWPPMGSGAFASAGWQRAAYHQAIEYYPAGGGSSQASLSPDQPTPNCYTIDLQSAADPWGEYFYFGGPGGTV